ncbi:MAG TPA: replication-associated recombination protein A [Candidatus Woesebacteria bacterium]|nr:replication-associated recombination protein A [Candidatus Woesebacteria bacterium]HNS94921.1 replication-associated recombination protein A [Candidatus Woesebacteria bacterium]
MSTPLAYALRPTSFADFIGQTHLVGPGKPITQMIESGSIASLVFWGPPGCGKTTLAHLIARNIEAEFIALSAVESGKEEVKKAITKAQNLRDGLEQKRTILFVDEVHRFNKAQQDALLKAVEEGILTLIATTTENPGFEVIPALVSRCHVYMLHALSEHEMDFIIDRCIVHLKGVKIDEKARDFLRAYAAGDSRRTINALETAAKMSTSISVELLSTVLQKKTIRYDKGGEDHFNTISAFIKSMRGSQPDAALHYLARMIDAGEDPVFIARRMVVFASEDVGNAQPTALVVATACMQAVHMIGMPEARIVLAQCATYLATAKKSTASYVGISEALHDIENLPLDPIPLHLRNPVNKVMKKEGYGAGHVRYPWQEQKEGETVEQEYMPKNLKGKKYYRTH